MKFFKKKEKTLEEQLKDMRTAEKIRLMETIQKNAAEGKPESDNLIVLKEMSYHASIDAEDEKKETERSNRRSKFEKGVGIASSISVIGFAGWNAFRDSKGENVNRSDGGKRIGRMLDSVASKFTEFKNNFKK